MSHSKERFLAKTQITDTCWMWKAFIRPDGYGMFGLGGRMIAAHRAAYILWREPIPKGAHVCHTCDIPACVNPWHLWLGTNADNVADKVRKNRQHRLFGPANAATKLSFDDKQTIRRLFESGNYTKAAISRMFDVSDTCIHLVLRGLRD